MHAREILETCLYVNDLAAARKFYCEVLGLLVVEEQPARHLFLRCGGRMLLLFLPDASSIAGSLLPTHGAHGPGHVAFAAADEDIAAWEAHLAACAIPLETTVHWPQGGTSLYFRDPAGNSLEIATPRMWGLDAAQTL